MKMAPTKRDRAGIDRRAILRALPLLPATASLVLEARPCAASASLDFLEQLRLRPGVAVGDGLHGRLAFDLSSLASGSPGGTPATVSNQDFYIRTRAPRHLPNPDDWSVRFSMGHDASGHFRDFGGLESDVFVSQLRERAEPMGRHLLECSGNSAAAGFGLLSVAEWQGVPLTALFQENLSNLHSATLIQVRGNDDHEHNGRRLSAGERDRSSVTGASWIFSIRQLKDAGAFLAVGMNGEPLPLDHGAPVRLIVPGWYGCTNIKWVESVAVVPREESPSHQMREFASRTHQEGQPELARDFKPATLDFAAMPVAVEGPAEDGSYLATGIAWGNPDGADQLEIRWQRQGQETAVWQPVPHFEPQPVSDWTVWSHRFTPSTSGQYEITLRLADPEIPTRRLDAGYYARTVEL